MDVNKIRKKGSNVWVEYTFSMATWKWRSEIG